ncbi:MAG: glycoside hydrolase family 27 protein [Eubacteriales bacterium]|nr:glycoside hydrolase family 27 protein [Eubacteriales bacterium]MDD3882289.1 glycoside hydrolase family 27 protein [Eubacteriales bacterium]MDD4512035.1 glycoside hydrolase family 27 protein [Eubacteriales bacterium]
MIKDSFAKTPPMGWNSWDCYGAAVNEEQLLGNARYMRDKLKEFGWEYVVCDIQWYEPLAESHEYHPFTDLCMDEYSRLIPAENRFPSSAGGKGFKPIADEIHAMGLKFGIHIMRGIPRQAVCRNTKILGSDKTARQVAQSYSVCPWNTDMYGVDTKKDGAQAYYDSLFALYASWGVDFVKVDDIANTEFKPAAPYSARLEIEAIRAAIDKCGRQIVLLLSPGPAPISEAWHLKRNANMWRMSGDFWDNWDALKNMFSLCERWALVGESGAWPDCDMLPLGRLTLVENGGRQTNFTKAEQRTMMNLWGIFRSPLMIGCEMRRNDDWTYSLLTNRDMICVNQHGGRAELVRNTAEESVWLSRTDNGRVYAALFNLSDEKRRVSLSLSDLPKTGWKEAWGDESFKVAEDALTAELEAHGSVLLFAIPAR